MQIRDLENELQREKSLKEKAIQLASVYKEKMSKLENQKQGITKLYCVKFITCEFIHLCLINAKIYSKANLTFYIYFIKIDICFFYLIYKCRMQFKRRKHFFYTMFQISSFCSSVIFVGSLQCDESKQVSKINVGCCT